MALFPKLSETAAARDTVYKRADSRRLHLHVSSSGHKSWRFKYRFEKKEQLLTPGAYPEVSLADAREKRDEAKKLLRASRDPRHAARRGRVVGDGSSTRSFEAVARDCHGLHPGRWKPVQAQDVITSRARYLCRPRGHAHGGDAAGTACSYCPETRHCPVHGVGRWPGTDWEDADAHSSDARCQYPATQLRCCNGSVASVPAGQYSTSDQT